jgi:hypothetical protein
VELRVLDDERLGVGAIEERPGVEPGLRVDELGAGVLRVLDDERLGLG